MSDRPSDGMALDELRDEFDWIIEFQGRMAERICGDADVHNLADYVSKLEVDNAKLRELVRDMWHEGAFEAGACYVKAAGKLEERTRELGIEMD